MMWPLFAKLLGAVCVTLCGAAWGLGRAKSILMQVRLLEEMLRFLQCVESELEFRAQETPLLLHSAQKRHGFAPFRFLWKGLPAGPGFPRQLAQRLSAARGRWDVSRSQCRAGSLLRCAGPSWYGGRWGGSAVNFAMHRPSFSAFWRKAEKDAQNRQKLFIVLGAGVGACVALLLL